MTDTASITAPERGLLGPESVTWQLHADPAMWVAGITSLFLQALHPRAVAGIVQNSNFQHDPFGRLARTADFVALSTYAPLDEVHRAARRIRSIHRCLRATDSRTGEVFHIDDPELLLWVHCAEVSSFLQVLRRAGYPITNSQADRYLVEQRKAASLVGLDAAEVPGSRADMADYFAAQRSVLGKTEDSDVIYRFLHRPPVPATMRPAMPAYTASIGHLAYSLLPTWAITHYNRRPYPSWASTALLRGLRLAALAVPCRWRWAKPQPHLLRAITRLGAAARPSVRRLPSCLLEVD